MCVNCILFVWQGNKMETQERQEDVCGRLRLYVFFGDGEGAG